MPADLTELRALFLRLMDAPADERARAMADIDPAIRAELEVMLQAHDDSTFLAEPTLRGESSAPGAALRGHVIGSYHILEKLGEGGWGEVFMADQQEPVRRRVALKILKAGMDSQQVLARFEAERQTLAIMEHPCIARVFDAGTTPDGRPYFVMELVTGVPVTDYCTRHEVPVAERLRLFADVCRAVQHAHGKGIIHRDLKPSNILVCEVDGRPSPKVIDFGIAKAAQAPGAETPRLTELRQLVGTPAYMSPEQAALGAGDIDTRSDIYSLGVVLYELLTGGVPFDSARLRRAALAEMHRIISEETPPKPSTRAATHRTGEGAAESVAPVPQRLLRGDLDWIVMKALEKEPARRYETAAAFAEDIARHLTRQPVLAGPPSALYRMRKFIHRHRAGVAAAAIAIAGLVTGLVLSVREARARKIQAERAESLLRLQDRIFRSAHPESARGGDYTLRELLNDFSVQFRQPLGVAPDVEISLRQTIGRAYQALGRGRQNQTEPVADIEKSDLQQAEDHFRAALDLALRTHGHESTAGAECRSLLGLVLRDEGRYSDARPELERALARHEAASGPRSIMALSTRAALAEVCQRLNEPARALELARASIDWPEPDEDAVRPLQLVAAVCLENGDFDSAATASMRGLEVALRADGGSEGPRCIVPLQTMASIRLKQGAPPEAADFAQRAADIAGRTYGDNHRLTLGALALLKDARAAADPATMVLAERKALFDALRESLGDEHPETAQSFLELVQTVLQSDPSSARNLVRGYVRPGAGDDGDYFDGYKQSASMIGKIRLRGSLADYENIAVKAISTVRAKLGAADRSTIDLERLLASLHRHQSKWDAAASAYQSILERCRTTYGNDHPRTLEAEIYFPDLWHEAKQHDRKEASMAGLPRRLLALPAETPGRGPLLNWLFLIYNDDERWAEALECSHGAIDSWTRHHPNHRNVVMLMSKSGTYLQRAGRFREGREMHGKAREYALTNLGEQETWTWNVSAQRIASLGNAVEWRDALVLAPQWLQGAEANLPRDDKGVKNMQMVAREIASQDQYRARQLKEAQTAFDEAVNDYGAAAREALTAQMVLARHQIRVADLPAAREALDRCRDGFAGLSGATPAERDQPVILRAWLEHFSAAGAPPEPTERVALEAFARLPLDKNDFTGPPLDVYFRTAALLRDMGKADLFFKVADEYDDRRFENVWPAARTVALVPRGALWVSLAPIMMPDDAWRSDAAWNDAGWRRGRSPFAMEEENMPATAIVQPAFFSLRKPVLLRHAFDLADGVAFDKLKLRLRCQDGVTIWLNGMEIVRHNLSDESAFAARIPPAAGSRLPRLFEVPPSALRTGRNLLAAAVHAARERTDLKSFCFDAVLEGLAK